MGVALRISLPLSWRRSSLLVVAAIRQTSPGGDSVQHMCEGQRLGLSSCLQQPPVTRLAKIRVSRPCLEARAEAGREEVELRFRACESSHQGATATPTTHPSEFLKGTCQHRRGAYLSGLMTVTSCELPHNGQAGSWITGAGFSRVRPAAAGLFRAPAGLSGAWCSPSRDPNGHKRAYLTIRRSNEVAYVTVQTRTGSAFGNRRSWRLDCDRDPSTPFRLAQHLQVLFPLSSHHHDVSRPAIQHLQGATLVSASRLRIVGPKAR